MRTMIKERKKEGLRLKGKGRADAKASRQLLLLCIPAGLSQILCKHRNAVQIEQNLFKAEVAQAAAALFSK